MIEWISPADSNERTARLRRLETNPAPEPPRRQQQAQAPPPTRPSPAPASPPHGSGSSSSGPSFSTGDYVRIKKLGIQELLLLHLLESGAAEKLAEYGGKIGRG